MVLIWLIMTLIMYVLYKSTKTPVPSPIEDMLYNALARKGYKVKRQVRCGGYYIDMVIGNIAIECDGYAFHSSPAQKNYDRKRSSYLYRNGYRSVLRFTGSEINRNVNDCVKKIEKNLAGQ